MASFILSLRYIAPVEAVDALLADHIDWLKAGHEAGHLIGWGRKVPREGGVILARGESRESIVALAQDDPFVKGGVAEVDVIEWAPTFLSAGLEGLAA
ncbi:MULTISPECIES: YciI family protein [Novosphingobium]|uniref:Uncharacterized conserved protein YciI, contains a putative active-site phosphohistidine n=1 Tax=Novosphingobium mathurense TaxID=428990 RepID=A0A1U6ICR9_9SPHN|nr:MULTISPECIES: YciI family protein [Novosphingobium]CDO35760.1 conserved hypothetical protein [Novosphingobium sp. KN65.2]SLK05773.1 Uncharacterized conserved protein YciI, contains a putative active-site phosphohistidine [Novosphingobium mathurense]